MSKLFVTFVAYVTRGTAWKHLGSIYQIKSFGSINGKKKKERKRKQCKLLCVIGHHLKCHVSAPDPWKNVPENTAELILHSVSNLVGTNRSWQSDSCRQQICNYQHVLVETRKMLFFVGGFFATVSLAAFTFFAPQIWNKHLENCKTAETLTSFKSIL